MVYVEPLGQRGQGGMSVSAPRSGAAEAILGGEIEGISKNFDLKRECTACEHAAGFLWVLSARRAQISVAAQPAGVQVAGV